LSMLRRDGWPLGNCGSMWWSIALILPVLLLVPQPLAAAQALVVITPDSSAQAPPQAAASAARSPAAMPAIQASEAEEFTPVLYFSVLAGANWPVGNMNVILDPSIATIARGEYAISPLVRIGAQFSYHAFDAERLSINDNEGIINLTLLAKALGQWGPYKPFALLGLGAYVSKVHETAGRRWDGGLQVGAGIELPVSEYMSAVTGTGLQAVLRGAEQTDYIWLEAYIGFLFKQP
jgi:hypothetical protein